MVKIRAIRTRQARRHDGAVSLAGSHGPAARSTAVGSAAPHSTTGRRATGSRATGSTTGHRISGRRTTRNGSAVRRSAIHGTSAGPDRRRYPVAHASPSPRHDGAAPPEGEVSRERDHRQGVQHDGDDQEVIAEMGQALVVGHQSDFPSVVAVRDGVPVVVVPGSGAVS